MSAFWGCFVRSGHFVRLIILIQTLFVGAIAAVVETVADEFVVDAVFLASASILIAETSFLIVAYKNTYQIDRTYIEPTCEISL